MAAATSTAAAAIRTIRIIRTARGRSRRSAGRAGCSKICVGRARLDDVPGLVLGGQEERAVVGDALGLLHVVGDDHDRHLVASSPIVSSMRRVEVGSSAEHGSSISSTSGLHGQGPGDAQALLLAARQRAAGLASRFLHLVPQPGPLQALLDQRRRCSRTCGPDELQARQHVVGDRHRRERVRLLEHHADARADLGRRAGRGRRCRSPSSSTSPASCAPGTSSCMRLRIRRNVDLPQPDGPISAVTAPAHADRDALEHLVVAEPGAHVLGSKSWRRASRRRRQPRPARVVGAGVLDVGPRSLGATADEPGDDEQNRTRTISTRHPVHARAMTLACELR